MNIRFRSKAPLWVERLLAKFNRKAVSIVFSPHLIMRESQKNLDLDKVDESIRTGKVDIRRSTPTHRVCLARYFGKSNETYFVVAAVHGHYWEVITAWKRKGR